jgi:hypothetical protein
MAICISPTKSPSYNYKQGCRCLRCMTWKQDAYARTKAWKVANPERWKELQRNSRMRKRKGCRVCGKQLPFPSMGTMYCVDCFGDHRKGQDKKYRTITQQEFEQFKLGQGCSVCGYAKCAAALDFHHLDPSFKERRVTARMWKNNLGKEELEKCILVCKNCHMEIHHEK